MVVNSMALNFPAFLKVILISVPAIIMAIILKVMCISVVAV